MCRSVLHPTGADGALTRCARLFGVVAVAVSLLQSGCGRDAGLPTAQRHLPPTFSDAAPAVNVAAAANGATVLASSVYSTGYAPSSAINGERAGANWGGGAGGWNDATFGQAPDWLEVSFASSASISRVDVFTLQDNFQAPVAPTLALTFAQYGLTDFRIETWNGTAWVTVPNGTITGNTQVWRQVTFPAVTTTKLRLFITGTRDGYSRVTELEAWTAASTSPPPALPLPTAFGKSGPSTGATVGPSAVTLSWSASSGATSYEYCIDTTDNSTCDASWVTTTSLSAALTPLAAGATFFWQVRARNATGTTDADGGTWWRVATTGVSFAVENLYLTQATQRPDGSVSLVAGRSALLRVFVSANASNTMRPDVRVRIFDGTTLLRTALIPAPESSVRRTTDEGVLSSTWNVLVASDHVRPGLRVIADVDPSAALPDADRTDNVWPRDGSPRPISVTTVPPFNVRFVPITIAGVTGAISESNKEQFLVTARMALPINTVVSDVRAPFTSSAPALQSDNANNAWSTVLSELYTLRVTDGAPAAWHYYGVARAPYSSGVSGIGYIGWPAALGWDYLPSGDRTATHEWGHNFNRLHAPCDVAGDAQYPYAGGVIGFWGWNAQTNALISPSSGDFMGYCPNRWTSDWTWSRVMAYRGTAALTALTLGGNDNGPVEGLLVWGRVVDGRVLLEPAFRVRAPLTPRTAFASHHAQLLDASGATLVDIPVSPSVVDHAEGQAEQHFAVVIPWSDALEQHLVRVRVSDVRQPLASAERASGAFASARLRAGGAQVASTLPDPEGTIETVDGGRTRIRWNAQAYPMAMIRDASTGEMLGFVRRPENAVTTNGRRVEVVYSDGVRSVVRR